MTRVERFWARVDKSGECWLWTGSVGSHGYGQMQYGAMSPGGHRQPTLAHRISWELAGNPLPHGLFVLHRCDVRRCVNPSHLFLGTNADNMRDMNEKGRDYRGEPLRGEASPCAKLTEKAVREIRRLMDGGSKQRVVARQFGVSQALVWRIKRRLVWRDLADTSKQQWWGLPL